MSEEDLQARLQDIVAKLHEDFSMVERVDAVRYTDATGDDAVRFLLVLVDPPGGGTYPYAELEPIMNRVYDLASDLGLMVYVRFRLASEDRDLAAGTYYG